MKKYEFFNSPIHGIGCKTTQNIKKEEIIALEPFIVIDEQVCDTIKNFVWAGRRYKLNGRLLINGLGSWTNHSDTNNIIKSLDKTGKYIIFTAIRDIEKDEELFVNYGPHWWDIRNKVANLTC